MSPGEWVGKLWWMYFSVYYAAVRSNGLDVPRVPWMGLVKKVRYKMKYIVMSFMKFKIYFILFII